MSIADVFGAIPELRAQAEALMLDEGTARRQTGTAYDEDTQTQVPTYDSAAAFTSRCAVVAPGVTPSREEVGGRTATTLRPELRLPVSTPLLLPGDEWVITYASDASVVPVGRVYRVVAPAGGSLATSRRYEVEAVIA